MKVAFLLSSLLPLTTLAFVPPTPKAPSTTAMSSAVNKATGAKQFEWADEPAGVKWFPNSAPYWDPLGLAEGQSKEFYWRLSHGEIKNGRVAMLACLDYIVKGFGFKFPFMFGDVSTEDIPGGLAALKVLPKEAWVQIFVLAFLLDVYTDQNGGNYVAGKVPGNVQPDTPMFKAPGDKEIRAKEINNGRLAMIAIFGMWAGELVTGGQQPFEILFSKL